MEQDNDNEDGSVSTFQSLAAEGDILAKMGDYRKAIEAYTKVQVGFVVNYILGFNHQINR